MDKYEFNVKVDQIKKLVSKSDYETAMKIADSIDWRRVRNANLLSMVAQVYEKNEEYSEAKNILLLAFERAPIGKRLLYKLTELAMKEKNVEEAEAYYREFCDLAPDDPRQHLLRYMILKEKGAPAEQLIHSLEQYTEMELDEKWLYELAALYHEAGRGAECVQMCDRIMLMFGLGKYVDKAMELKLQYAPLTSYQMDLVENRDKYEAKLRAVEQAYNVPEEYDEEEPAKQAQVPNKPYTQENAAWQANEEEADETQNQQEEEQNIQVEEESAVSPIDAVLAARMREEEAEEKLAREMAQIPAEDFNNTQEEEFEQTRILTDIKNVIPMPERKRGYDHLQADQTTEAEPGSDSAAAEYVPEESDDLDVEELWDETDVKSANHLMIEAREPETGLKIAIDALKKIHKELGSKQPVVKISGSKLNKKGIFAVADKIAGKDLIVEEAGDMNHNVLTELNAFMDKDETGVIVVLIDNSRQMEELHRDYPQLASKFECIGSGEDAEEKLADVEEAVKRQAAKEEKMAKAAVIRTAEPEKPAVKTRQPVSQVQPARKVKKPEIQVETPEEMAAPVRRELAQADASKKRDISRREMAKSAAMRAPDPEPEYEQAVNEAAAYRDPAYNDGADSREMDIDEFAEYACKYASEIDCSVTGKSMLALYERIEIMEEEGIPLTRENAEELIEEAADRAEKPSLKKLITGVFSPKYNKDGLLILKEEHFI